MYRFIMRFYGLTTMPTEFQRIMDEILEGLSNNYTFIGGTLTVTKGTKKWSMSENMKRFGKIR